MAIAMHHSRARNSTAIAVLVGIANHDGDGGAWPTVSTLAHYARVSERQVQRTLNELIALGEIRREIQAGGTVEFAPTDRPNLYHFTLKCPPHCDRTRNHRLACLGCSKTLPRTSHLVHYHSGCEPASQPELEGVTPMSPPDAGVTGGVPPVSPKPSLEPFINYPQADSHKPAYVGNRASAHESDAYGAAIPAAAAASAEAAQAPEIDADGDSHQPASATPAAGPIDSPQPCPRWRDLPHTPDAHGTCIDCGAPVPGHVNATTGEIH